MHRKTFISCSENGRFFEFPGCQFNFGKLQVGHHRPGAGRPDIFQEEQRARVLRRFYDDPSTSTRRVAAQEGTMSRSSVHRIARNDGLYPFHRQKVQKLMPDDPAHRMNFAQWVINQVEIDPELPFLIMQSDEAKFTRSGIFNQHNVHNWSHENPHNIVIQGHQERFSVNVWVGMVGGYVVGPYILPDRLTGQNYLIFLEEVLPELLEDVPLAVRHRMWFQHDGAPPHFFRAVRTHLNARYRRRWMGRGGHVPWPARSPDFSWIDFCYWGWMKELVYDGTEINSVEELVARIAVAAGVISERRESLRKACENFVERCRLCLRNDVQGGHFEHLL